MVLFKCLSLKALNTLQKHEVGGGMANQSNHINVSLGLCINIHQYINAQSHLLHTLSLPLSLSLSIHTLTHLSLIHI